MKKVLYLIVTLLEIIIFAGTYIVNYFTVKKLGMTRWVNFHGMRWEKNYPIFQIKVILILLLVVFLLLTLGLYLKRKKFLKRIVGVMLAVTCVVVIGVIGYMLLSSFESMRAYYLISIILVVVAVIQLIKTFIGIIVCRCVE